MFRVLRALNAQGFWEAYARFGELITIEAPNAAFVPPGTEFGVIRLSVAEAVDVAVPHTGALVCRDSIAQRLLSDGYQFEVYPTIIQSGQKRVKEDYVEIFAPPLAHKSNTLPGELCSKCLRFQPGLDDSLPVANSSIPSGTDVFRVFERPAVIIAKENFADALSKYNAPNVRWKQVEVV